MGRRCLESTLYRPPALFPRHNSGGGVVAFQRRPLRGLPPGTNHVHWVPPRVARSCPVWNKEEAVTSQTALRLLDKDMMDKQRALDAALGQIERAFGKGSIMKLGSREAPSDIDVVSTGSLGLDIALGIGGLPRGRVVEIY